MAAPFQSFAPIDEYRNLINSHNNEHIFTQLQYSEGAFYDEKTNTIGTLSLPDHHLFQRQPYVANGYIGARIPGLGQGFALDLLSNSPVANTEDLTNGWPQFNRRFAGAFAAGFYNLQETTNGTNFPWLHQYGWDSTISAIPQWTSLTVTSEEGFSLNPSLPSESWGSISDYSQTLSFEDGVVSTLYTWMGKLNLRFNVTANKKHINVGTVTLEIHNPTDKKIEMTVADSLDFKTSHNCKLHSIGSTLEGLFVMVSPDNVKDVYAAIVSKVFSSSNHTSETGSNSASLLDIEKTLRIKIEPGQKELVTKIVGIVTSDLDPAKFVLASAVLEGAEEASSLERLLLSSDNKLSWKREMGDSLNILFPDEPLLTLAARSSLYHLHANTRPGATGLTSALGVSGLSSDSYGGQVFWDTDLWMLMGILPFNARVSESLLNYRTYTRQQAIENIKSPSNPFSNSEGAIYPWTSGRYGNCTASGPCFDYEYHVNTAIAHSAFNLYLSGAFGEEGLRNAVFPVVNDAARFYCSYVSFNDTLGKYTSNNLTDPDEFANHINNGAYTNTAISNTVEWAAAIADHLGEQVPSIYRLIPGNTYIPTSPDDSRVVLEYSDMPASVSIKQADVVMMTYPLQHEFESAENAQANLDYYAMKQASTGPAMTYPIFSIVSSATLDSGCSEESFLMKSVQPYLRGPFAQFLEQSNDNFETNGGTHPAFPFLTAHGGFLQAILHGLLGLRFQYETIDGKISRYLKLKTRTLSMMPNGIYFPEIHYMNQTLTLNLSSTTIAIHNKGPIEGSVILEESVVNLRVFTNNNEYESASLKPMESVSFSVEPRTKVRSGSLTECGSAWFTNINKGMAGDVTLLMHDGRNSTRWKAARNTTSKILIDLKERKPVREGFINWGSLPPRSLKIHTEIGTIERSHPDLQLSLDLLSKVSFGIYRGNKTLSQHELFQKVHDTRVDISAPFDAIDFQKIRPATRHNTTSIKFPNDIETRFLIVEIEGVHENVEGGAEIYSIDLF